MTTPTDEQISAALPEIFNSILTRHTEELRSIKQDELEKYWFFRFDAAASKEWSLYEFYNALDTYGSHCREWEEMHNGHVCVVERVRDKYLMPKIREFLVAIGGGAK